MIIALMGNDGSGKTTIAKELVKIFRGLGFKVIYKHEYDYTLLKFIFKIIGNRRVEKERKKMILYKEKSWKYYFWPILVWFDVHCYLIYSKIFERNSIIILDRYLFDHYLSFKYLGYLTKFSEWLFIKFSLKPDVYFILWVDPKIAYLRKRKTHKYSMNFYEEQTKRYIKLSNDLGIKAINTNKTVLATINEVLSCMPKDKIFSFIRKGAQNRVLLYFTRKYNFFSVFPYINQILEEKKQKTEKTLSFIKNFFGKNGFVYCIIKTLYSKGWMGNDIDVIVSKKDLKKIIMKLKELNLYDISIKNKFTEKGKFDIKIKNGLTIDLHSYIGWRNVEFLLFEDIMKKRFIYEKNGLYFANEKVNSVIIILTHIFEKGFVTLDEYEFLKNHFDELFMQKYFSNLYTFFREYISWFKKTLEKKRNYSFPLFVPISIIVKCYLKLLFKSRKINSDLFWKLKSFIRDISLMIIWRFRYTIKNKLPFEVIS
ncbi:MAG: hypothetical protein QXI58_06960 [Candidatus Micrarchaeia archaeon]